MGGSDDCKWLLEKPSQCPVALPIGYLDGRIINLPHNYTLPAVQRMRSFLSSYFTHGNIRSNLSEKMCEDVTPASSWRIASVVEDWPLHIRRCPLSDWMHLRVFSSQPCLHCFKNSHYFDDQRLCMGDFCSTDWLFLTRGKPGIFLRCRCCCEVIGCEGYLSCGDPICVLYFLRLCRITMAYGSVFHWSLATR